MAVLLPAAGVLGDVPPLVYVYNMSSNASERILMASLQGVVARTTPEVHLGESIWLTQMQQLFPGTMVARSSNPGFFLARYRPLLAGYILSDDVSRNVATSVAGALGGVIVDIGTPN